VDFAKLRLQREGQWGGNSRKDGKRREPRFSQDRRRSPVKSKIGKFDLGQDQYQRKQKELDT